jgi:hypothetical protein
MAIEIHGYYQRHNNDSYGVHLSDDGDSAKLIFNDEDLTTTDWLDIVWCKTDDDNDWEPIIDPNGYHVYLNGVFKVY